MIPKGDITYSLLTNALNCGHLDVNFFVDLVDNVENKKFIINGKEWFLFYVDQEGNFIDSCFEWFDGSESKPDINLLIFAAFRLITEQINNLYNIDLEEGEQIEIYTNCLDSHLYLKEDALNKYVEDGDLTAEQVKEIKAIFEVFN